MFTTPIDRTHAIDIAIASLENRFFKALCEPARVAVLKRVMLLGRADVTEIAAELPQERSVISRHLQVLSDARIVRAHKSGRQMFYEVDGLSIIQQLENMLSHAKGIVVHCCPENKL